MEETQFLFCFFFFIRKQAEDRTESLKERLAELEDEYDEAESKNVSLTAQLNDAEKNSDESSRAHKELSNRGQIDDSKLERLQAELEETLSRIEEMEDKFQGVSLAVETFKKYVFQ